MKGCSKVLSLDVFLTVVTENENKLARGGIGYNNECLSTEGSHMD
jgi:hypothetical protein